MSYYESKIIILFCFIFLSGCIRTLWIETVKYGFGYECLGFGTIDRLPCCIVQRHSVDFQVIHRQSCDESSYHEENPPVSNYVAIPYLYRYVFVDKESKLFYRKSSDRFTSERISNILLNVVYTGFIISICEEIWRVIIEEVQVFDNNLEELQVQEYREQLYDFILRIRLQ